MIALGQHLLRDNQTINPFQTDFTRQELTADCCTAHVLDSKFENLNLKVENWVRKNFSCASRDEMPSPAHRHELRSDGLLREAMIYMLAGCARVARSLSRMPRWPMLGRAQISRGAVLLAAFCMLSSAMLLWRTLSGREKPQGTELAAFKKRISPLRGSLPPDAAVGYISDLTPDPSLRSVLELRMTQYALVPVMVEDGPNYAYVIGNFHGPLPVRTPEIQQLTILKDFGNGVFLFRGTPR